MLASADTSAQVDGVVVGRRDWRSISPYGKMSTVAAAYVFVKRVQCEHGRRRSLGLVSFGDRSSHWRAEFRSNLQPTAPNTTEQAASLSKYAPRARNVGTEAAKNRRGSKVEVFKRWGGM